MFTITVKPAFPKYKLVCTSYLILGGEGEEAVGETINSHLKVPKELSFCLSLSL